MVQFHDDGKEKTARVANLSEHKTKMQGPVKIAIVEANVAR